MSYDLTDLDYFYQTPLGEAVATQIKHRINNLWDTPMHQNQQGLLVGFPLPFISPEQSSQFFWQTTTHLGVRSWPSNHPNRTVLADDHALPFVEQYFDRILIAHTLENSSYPREFLSEINRILTSRGRAIFIVPNRTGLWVKNEKTPFGMGRPYSMSQLKESLKEAGFNPLHIRRAGFFPPWDIMAKTAPWCDRIGHRFCPALAGINILEVSKQIYSVTPLHARTKKNLIRPKPLVTS